MPLPAGLAYSAMAGLALIPMKCRRGFSICSSSFASCAPRCDAPFLEPTSWCRCDLDRPSPHDVVWRPANARILQVQESGLCGSHVTAAAAGQSAAAPVHGRARPKPWRFRIGRFMKDAFPGYIDWEEFMANQRLADNLNHYDANRHGVPRQGNALLGGIAVCGRAAAAWGCIIPARTATTLSIFVALISINMAGLAARRCAPWASMRRSKDCCSKR